MTAIGLIGTHYRDFGPTLACEKLSERHDLHLSVESTRQMMIKAGYWRPQRGGTVCAHPMRERRARFGELIRIDGSPHDWFEGRGDYCTLPVFIDDATGQLTQLRFAPTETALDYMRVLHDHILMYGVPVALYSDKHSIFRINAADADPEAETQFSRAARELGIECIHAHSPQAKGRVERANQTLQDRLVKEMRLAGIDNMDSANAWLPGYLADHNRRFAVQPKAGLMWEVKTADGGLRDWAKTYTNYDSTTADQKGTGTPPTQTEIDAATNSIGFKNAVNATNLCGYSDWRMPTADELQSIVDYGVAIPGPTVDASWFLNTQGNAFWSSSPYVGNATNALGFKSRNENVNFNNGNVNNNNRSNSNYVRLVRAGEWSVVR